MRVVKAGSRRPILALDFDGVLHRYDSGWKGARVIPDPPVDGAIAFILAAVEHFDVVIHASRARYFGGRRAMKAWLRKHIEEHLWQEPWTDGQKRGWTGLDRGEDIAAAAGMFVSLRLSFPLWKPPAHVTIDDRAVTFNGTFPALGELLDFKPWNRRGR